MTWSLISIFLNAMWSTITSFSVSRISLYRYGFSVFQSSGLAISNTAVPSSAILPSATTAPFLSSIEIFTFNGE